MMTDLSDIYTVLSIFIPVTGFKKGHDLMIQNWPSFSCLIIITSVTSFPLIILTYATSSSVWNTRCIKIGTNILKIGIFLSITNKSIIWCKNITSYLPTKNIYLYTKWTTNSFRDLSLLSVENYVKVRRWISSKLVMWLNFLIYQTYT